MQDGSCLKICDLVLFQNYSYDYFFPTHSSFLKSMGKYGHRKIVGGNNPENIHTFMSYF